MPKSFTFKQAKELAQTFSDFASDIYAAIDFYKAVARDVGEEVEFLTHTRAFENVVQGDFELSVVRPTKLSVFKNLLTLLYSYEQAKRYSEYFKTAHAENVPKLRKAVANLAVASNPIKWAFTSSYNKQKAEQDYDFLAQRQQSVFYTNTMRMLDELYSLKKTNFGVVAKSFEQNISRYKNLLEQICPKIELGNKPRIVQKVLDQYQKLEDVLGKIDQRMDHCDETVMRSVESLLDEQLLENMRKIPVDQLSRSQGGLRIKSLVDAGFTTIADTYLANVGALEAVHGISWEMAKVIKSISAKFAVEMRAGLKIELTADNKSKASTELVKDVYRRRKRQQILVELDIQNNLCAQSLEESSSVLEELGSGRLYWLEDNRYKQEVVDSYATMARHVFGTYAQVVQSTLTQMDACYAVGAKEAWDDFEQNSVYYFNAIEELCPEAIGGDDQLYGLPEELAQEIQRVEVLPGGLTCSLRRYQEWGVKYILHQERVLLGDEMGLGKTVQAIATMVSLKNTGETHFIVVCPASVLTNWCREISKHSTLVATNVHGAQKHLAFKSWLQTGGVAVTTYETTRHFKLPEDYKVGLLVLDEAHYIKNPQAQRTVNCKRLCQCSDRLLFMTGTPLENRVDEMISLVSILNPDLAKELSSIAFMSTAEQFKQKIAPVYYRRKRDDVLTELPQLIESKEWCEMGNVEQSAYEDAVLHGTYPEVRRLSWHIDDVARFSCKANRLVEIVEEAEQEGRKVLVFSFFLDTINKVSSLLGNQCCQPITGAVSPAKRQQIIDQFNQAPAGQVLVAQILSGGTGLNIQSASVVVICEPQLKPSIENQAISRAYRMGQAHNVLVYRLLCEDTIDEKITQMLEDKQTVFDTFADESVAAEQEVEIDEQTLGDIIREEVDRINRKNGNFGTSYVDIDDIFGN